MDCKAMNGDFNQGVKARISVSKSSELNQTSDSYRLPEYKLFKQIIKKLLLSLRGMAQHHNGAIRNDSMLPPGLLTL